MNKLVKLLDTGNRNEYFALRISMPTKDYGINNNNNSIPYEKVSILCEKVRRKECDTKSVKRVSKNV